MIETFKKNISSDKFFADGANFEIERQSDYISYPEFLNYFKDLKTVTKHSLIIGINFTYGWMPTILKFHSDKFDEAIKILNSLKRNNKPSIDNLNLLKELFNNSLVGTTKLLHFIHPEVFAIWDSRVYRYLTGKEPNEKTIGNCKIYFEYLEFCRFLIKEKKFDSLQKSIENKVGYSMTKLRIAELIMYSKGGKQK